MSDQEIQGAADETPVLPWWRFGFRLLRIAVMLILAFWLSRNGDAFFYQGF